MPSFDDIAHALNAGITVLPINSRSRKAAVALLIREDIHDLQVLFIERAPHEGDPWSGDLGFPGGKVEDADPSIRAAAERETMEELGFDLGSARFLGQLPDIEGAHIPISVACFVYGVTEPTPFALSDEIREAFWIPLCQLEDLERHEEEWVTFRGDTFLRPAIRLPVVDKPVLWGITYRIIMQFLNILAGKNKPLEKLP